MARAALSAGAALGCRATLMLDSVRLDDHVTDTHAVVDVAVWAEPLYAIQADNMFVLLSLWCRGIDEEAVG